MSRMRFIAGAVCPECKALDRIVLEDLEGVRRRRCVACGHTDTMATASAAEPETRVSRRPSRDVEASPVRIVDPRGKPS